MKLKLVRQDAVPEQQVSEVDELRCALESRTVIAKAIGILMERHRLDDEQAFAYLVRLSQNQNVKLRLIAADVVAETDKTFTSASTQTPCPASPAPPDKARTPLASVPSASGVRAAGQGSDPTRIGPLCEWGVPPVRTRHRRHTRRRPAGMGRHPQRMAS
jgi:hypothetical protein